jgi:hypothetical protein
MRGSTSHLGHGVCRDYVSRRREPQRKGWSGGDAGREGGREGRKEEGTYELHVQRHQPCEFEHESLAPEDASQVQEEGAALDEPQKLLGRKEGGGVEVG